MSRAYKSLLAALCVASLMWACLTLYVQSVRVEYRSIVDAVYNRKEPPTLAQIMPALAAYERALRIKPCDRALHKERLLLLAQKADIAIGEEGFEDDDQALAETQEGLAKQLACSPTDGKAWLDLAMIEVERAGFTKRAMEDYKMSARVAPRESWLVEKRMLFALMYLPLLDEEAKAAARRDIAVLESAHPDHWKRVVRAAQVESIEGLYTAFAPAQ